MSKDLETKEKKALEKSDETTWSGNTYVPEVDIFESEDALVLKADVPGVRKQDVEIDLDDDVLTLQARVSLADYEGLLPLLSEYNVGNYYRRFSLGEMIDRDKISADLEHGVLTVTLPKREAAKPRRIALS